MERKIAFGVSCDPWQSKAHLVELHRSMGLSCSASAVEIKTTCQENSLRPEQNKDYSLPWEKQSKQVQSSRTCCFCWCCLCTCLCKSRIVRGSKISAIDYNPAFTQIDVEEVLDGLQRPPLDKIYEWAEDFDSLIRDEAGKGIFERFLQQEYSEENLLFWLEVEKMKDIEQDTERIVLARKIYKRFIEPRSEKEVNIEFRIRKSIELKMDRPTPDIFDPAQTQVYVMMYRQSYPRFLSSKIYKALLMWRIKSQEKDKRSSEKT